MADGAGSVGAGGTGGASAFVSGGGAGVGDTVGVVSSCFTFLLALFAFFFLRLGKTSPHSEGMA